MAEAVVRAVQRNPEGLPPTDRARTRLVTKWPDQVTRQRSRMRESCTYGSVGGVERSTPLLDRTDRHLGGPTLPACSFMPTAYVPRRDVDKKRGRCRKWV